jgi:hypothetical protein
MNAHVPINMGNSLGTANMMQITAEQAGRTQPKAVSEENKSTSAFSWNHLAYCCGQMCR